MGKNRVFDNLYTYFSNDFYEDCKDYDLEDVFFNTKTFSKNHDKIIHGIKKQWIIEFTTGSTGKPFPTVKTRTDKLIESAYLLKQRKKNDKDITLENGFKFLHSLQPELSNIDLWKFSDRDIGFVVNKWIENKPKWMLATPQIYAQYAVYIIKNKLQVFNENELSFIEYTSQNVFPEEKNIIQKVYKCKMVNSFGARECWNIAYECTCGNMHMNNEYLIVDLVNQNNQVIDDYEKEGHIIVTHLSNTTMPLIKYKYGDVAKRKKSNCGCGNTSDILVFSEERENAKLINTSFYGTGIFRRVMRGIYFHDYITDIRNISIVQDADYHLSVYLDKEKKNDAYFEKRFYERTKSVVEEIDKFVIDYIYGAFIMPETINCKETIFKNIIGK
jgi:phenylacetate-CoA ligase